MDTEGKNKKTTYEMSLLRNSAEIIMAKVKAAEQTIEKINEMICMSYYNDSEYHEAMIKLQSSALARCVEAFSAWDEESHNLESMAIVWHTVKKKIDVLKNWTIDTGIQHTTFSKRGQTCEKATSKHLKK